MGEKITDKGQLEDIRDAEFDGFDFEHVTTEELWSGRWREGLREIVRRKADGKLFAYEWQRGLTENCDHEHGNEAYEVEAIEKVITRREYTYTKVN